jgi:hypothetical protein
LPRATTLLQRFWFSGRVSGKSKWLGRPRRDKGGRGDEGPRRNSFRLAANLTFGAMLRSRQGNARLSASSGCPKEVCVFISRADVPPGLTRVSTLCWTVTLDASCRPIAMHRLSSIQ